MSIYSGTMSDFDSLIYGQPHPGTLQYLQNNIQQFANSASEMTRAFFDRTREVYDSFYSSEALRRARAAVERFDAAFNPDAILPLTTLSEMRTAKETMRNYIMSDPWIREQYQRQLIEGYSGYYHDPAVGEVAEMLDHQQRLMDGYIVEHPTNPEEFMYTLWYGYESENTPKLDLDQKENIFATRREVIAMIKRGKEDPVSVYGAML